MGVYWGSVILFFNGFTARQNALQLIKPLGFGLRRSYGWYICQLHVGFFDYFLYLYLRLNIFLRWRWNNSYLWLYFWYYFLRNLSGFISRWHKGGLFLLLYFQFSWDFLFNRLWNRLFCLRSWRCNWHIAKSTYRIIFYHDLFWLQHTRWCWWSLLSALLI